MATVDKWLIQAGDEYEKGRTGAAIRLCNKVLKKEPAEYRALHLLGVIKIKVGHLDYGIDLLRRATAAQPDAAEIYNSLGIALRKRGMADAAIEAYTTALQLQPELSGVYVNLGNLYRDQERYDEAVGCYEEGIRKNPRDPRAHMHLGHVFTSMGSVNDAVDCYRRALKLAPNLQQAHSSLLLLLHCLPSADASQLALAHCSWAESYQKGITPMNVDASNGSPHRKLHIGYLSKDFVTHSVAFFLEAILEKHDYAEHYVTCYNSATQIDATTRRLKALASSWREVAALTDGQVAEQIRQDRVDILVDLGGHTTNSRLRVLALRPAPVQVTYLGYPDTTGLSTVDYRLTDARADPIGFEQYYTEKLIRLDRGFLCYRPPSDAPPIAEQPVYRNGFITFGSFNHVIKLNELVVSLWANVLNRVPGSKLRLKASAFSSESVRKRYLTLFTKEGISGDRVQFLSRIDSPAGHLEAYGDIDIALDPFPYNGTTTTCEAMWMGVPVISLVGQTHAGRVGLSLLSQVGLPELCAASCDEYVEIAHSFALDTERLKTLRLGFRNRLTTSPLCDAASFTSRLEMAYRAMWRQSVSRR